MTNKFGNHLLSRVLQEKKIKTLFYLLGFPGSSVVKNLPAIAADVGSGPGLEGSHMLWSSWTHAPQLLSLCSIAWEPPLLRPRAAAAESSVPWSLCSIAQAPPLLSLCSMAWSHYCWGHERQLQKALCPGACAPQPGASTAEPVLYSLAATTAEATLLQLLKAVCPGACASQQGRLLQQEVHTLQLERGPCSLQLEEHLHNHKDPAPPIHK